MNKNRVKFLGKNEGIWEHNDIKVKLPLLFTKRNDITPLLGVNWFKKLTITINQISLDQESDQSETISTKYKKLFDTKHTKNNTEVRKQKKTECYTIQQKTQPIPYHLKVEMKNQLDRLNES